MLHDEFCANLLKHAKVIEPRSAKLEGDVKWIARSQPFRRDKKDTCCSERMHTANKTDFITVKLQSSAKVVACPIQDFHISYE